MALAPFWGLVDCVCQSLPSTFNQSDQDDEFSSYKIRHIEPFIFKHDAHKCSPSTVYLCIWLSALWRLRLHGGSDDLQLDLGFHTFIWWFTHGYLRSMQILTSGYIYSDLTFVQYSISSNDSLCLMVSRYEQKDIEIQYFGKITIQASHHVFKSTFLFDYSSIP